MIFGVISLASLYTDVQVYHRRWFVDRWTQQSYKAQRWHFIVPVMSAIQRCSGTTVSVWPVQTSVTVQTISSTVVSMSSPSFNRDSTLLQWTTLHTWHVTSSSTQHNSLTPASISVLKYVLVLALWTQPALNSLFSVTALVLSNCVITPLAFRCSIPDLAYFCFSGFCFAKLRTRYAYEILSILHSKDMPNFYQRIHDYLWR